MAEFQETGGPTSNPGALPEGVTPWNIPYQNAPPQGWGNSSGGSNAAPQLTAATGVPGTPAALAAGRPTQDQPPPAATTPGPTVPGYAGVAGTPPGVGLDPGNMYMADN